jgi:hypothetical protein
MLILIQHLAITEAFIILIMGLTLGLSVVYFTRDEDKD